MPNQTTGLWQTLVLPAVTSLEAPTAFKKAMLRKIYVQPQPQQGAVGRYINVNIPTVSENDVIDIGNGPIQVTSADHTTVQLDVNNNPSKAIRIPDFDQIRTPKDLRTFYLQPAFESVAQKVNRSVCNLVTSTNFNVHTSITAGADVFTRAHLAQAWSNLMDIGAPDNDLHFVTSNVPWSNMVGNDANGWIKESEVGIRASEAAIQRAMLMPAFNADLDFDQQMPQPSAGATYAGLFFHRSAIALVPVTVNSGRKPHVEETYVQLDGVPGLTFRVQFGYSYEQQGWILHIHCVYALAVVRPNFGSYLVTT